ncbi:MAG: ThuA domain-containing protein, partial [Pirellulales bacterium]
MRFACLITLALGCLVAPLARGAPADAAPKTIVLIAGTKSHGPGHHEYEKGARLLAACLEAAPDLPEIRTEVYLDGWPDDEAVLGRADTIFLFSDGSDRDVQAHPLLRGERLKTLEKLMARGVGLVAIHYTVFVPSRRGGPEFLEWIGGYFDYENGSGPNKWFSKIGVHRTQAEANASHPIARGLGKFELEEEYYYNIRFRPQDERLTPILTTPIPGEEQPQVVAWAVERDGGGRGFGFTGGHFHSNWGVDEFRKLVLNALVWTAKIEVPPGGVESRVSKADLTVQPPHAPGDAAAPIKTLILTGHNHPAHDWRATTKALQAAFQRDPRFDVSVVVDPELLAQESLAEYDLLVQNYVNWERPGLGDESKAALLKFVESGKGLAVVHFANGAFLDWPEYRKLARRVWIEGKSGHDNYGPFTVHFTGRRHPITEGLHDFETTDELYHDQQGDLPIEPLATAGSRNTGRDEPMAFAYEYGKGRVFQTVLGHDEQAIRNAGTAELIRRGSAWAAGRDPVGPAATSRSEPPVEDPVEEPAVLAQGKFGKALVGPAPVAAAPNEAYQDPPLTVECWARLNSKNGFNILVANSAKESSNHWEIYSYAGSGAFSAYLPGFKPAEIISDRDITDGRWHHVAMVFEPRRVRLYVDARQAADARVEPVGNNRQLGPLYFASYP